MSDEKNKKNNKKKKKKKEKKNNSVCSVPFSVSLSFFFPTDAHKYKESSGACIVKYGVATISGFLKITSLLCRISSL